MHYSIKAITLAILGSITLPAPSATAQGPVFLGNKILETRLHNSFASDDEIAHFVGAETVFQMRMFIEGGPHNNYIEVFSFPTRQEDCAPFSGEIEPLEANDTRGWDVWTIYQRSLTHLSDEVNSGRSPGHRYVPVESGIVVFSNIQSAPVFVRKSTHLTNGSQLRSTFAGKLIITCAQVVNAAFLSKFVDDIMSQGVEIEKNIFAAKAFQDLQARIEKLERKVIELED